MICECFKQQSLQKLTFVSLPEPVTTTVNILVQTSISSQRQTNIITRGYSTACTFSALISFFSHVVFTLDFSY